jgi:hypothetical protein
MAREAGRERGAGGDWRDRWLKKFCGETKNGAEKILRAVCF